MMNVNKIDETLTVKYGIDRTTGVFVEFHFEEETESANDSASPLNYSEFYPFAYRLDAMNIKEMKKFLGRARYKALCELPLGEYNVYFHFIRLEDHLTTENVSKKLYKFLWRQIHKNKIRTLGDYLKLILMFEEGVTFGYAEWWQGIGNTIRVYSDLAPITEER